MKSLITFEGGKPVFIMHYKKHKPYREKKKGKKSHKKLLHFRNGLYEVQRETVLCMCAESVKKSIIRLVTKS